MNARSWILVRLLCLCFASAILLTACFPDEVGVLQVINDRSTAVTELYISPSDDDSLGNNLLQSPMEKGYMYEISVAPGYWDVFTADTRGEIRYALDVRISNAETRPVYLSAMRVYDDDGEDNGEGEGEHPTGSHELEGHKPFSTSLSDGTRLTFPAIDLPGSLTSLTLSKENSSPDLSGTEIEPVGATRVVTFDSFDPVELGGNFSDFTPSLVFPASSVADHDPATLTAVRVSDLLLGDDDLPGHISYLPITINAQGDYEITDFYFPDSIISDLAQAKSTQKAIRRPREIRYSLGTFEGSYNWSAQSLLQRFYPTADKPEKRQSWDDLTEDEQSEEEIKEIMNMIVLVHGHNEEEKEYGLNTTAAAPWYFAYKQDVWTPFYDYLLRVEDDLLDCTAVYEFIYPSYKPIFTDMPGFPGARLDQDFARKINSAVYKLMYMQDWSKEYELRLYIVAHSMGGLVARAGIQRFDENSHEAFQKLVTWGTPHMGSALVSLRYVLGAPPGIYRVGYDGTAGSLPLENIDNTLFAIRRRVDTMQVDTPGTRDLRYANSHTTTAHNLALDKFFSVDISPFLDDTQWNKYELRSGSEIYNKNLKLLNAQDVYRLSDKYHAFFGVTSKRAEVQFRWYAKPYIEGNDIALGALIIPWLIENADGRLEGHKRGASDGASNLASMMGAGVMGAHYDLGDIDHEEYYGAPSANGQFTRLDLADKTLNNTFYSLDIPACVKSPLRLQSIEPERGPIGCGVTLKGSGFGKAPVDAHGRLQLDSPFFNANKVTVGGVEAEITSWKDTAIGITVPEYHQVTGDVVLHKGKEQSTAFPFTSFIEVEIEMDYIGAQGYTAEQYEEYLQSPESEIFSICCYEFRAVVTTPYSGTLSYDWKKNGETVGTEAVIVGCNPPSFLFELQVTDGAGRTVSDYCGAGIADI
ncbi:MAG: hypothetical protein GX130_10375 [Candidatus Hydrogenedens sp.]|jgi:pimeloyl-ACP methyl ester carboxylesterase|nr:hypothetical protein [Candidatus Hydrogenedens sp.]